MAFSAQTTRISFPMNILKIAAWSSREPDVKHCVSSSSAGGSRYRVSLSAANGKQGDSDPRLLRSDKQKVHASFVDVLKDLKQLRHSQHRHPRRAKSLLKEVIAAQGVSNVLQSFFILSKTFIRWHKLQPEL